MIIKGFIGKEGNTLGLSDKPWETLYVKQIDGATLGTSEKPFDNIYTKELESGTIGTIENPVDIIYTREIEVENQKPSIPTGFIGYYGAKTVPVGFLICNGAEISIETYQDLYNIIGLTYGTPTTEGKFLLPNLINRFPHGHTTVGTVKAAGLPNISGTIGNISTTNTESNLSGFKTYSGSFSKRNNTVNTGYFSNVGGNSNGASILNFNASSSNSIYGAASTVQPPALTLLPCIKY